MNKNNYKNNVEEFLNNYRIGTGTNIKYTHVAMGDTFYGKFCLNDKQIKEFTKIYAEAIENGYIFNIAERPKDYGPLLIDLDLEIASDDYKEDERLYNNEMVFEVIDTYRKVMKDYLYLDDNELVASVFEKPQPTKKNKIIKDGIHIIFHEIVAHYKLRYIIRHKVVEILNNSNNFKRFINSVDKIIDKAVVHTNSWLLIGSKKKDGQLYELKYIYDHENNKTDIIYKIPNKYKMLRLYSLQDRLKIEENASRYLETITDDDIEKDFSDIGFKPKNKNKKENNKNNNNDIITEIEKCLKCIDTYDNYEEWRDIALIINNELGEDGLNILLNWSSNSENYDKEKVIKFYNNIQKNEDGLKLGTLKKLAKDNNPDLYKTLFNKIENDEEYNFFFNLSTTSIADDFKKNFGDKFIYKDSESKLYYFNGVYWNNENNKLPYLNNFISHEYFNYIFEKFSIFEKQTLKNTNDNDINNMINKLNKIKLTIGQLKDYNKRQNFLKEITGVLTNENIKFDENPYLFAFNDVIYNLEKFEFIEPNPNDYISTTTGYNFKNNNNLSINEYIDNQKENIKDLHNIINTIFLDKDLKDLYLTIASTGLDGISLERFILANGSGGNGKGLLNEFLKYVVGGYSYVFPSQYLLQSLKLGSSPELANLNNKRLVFSREPDADQKFKCSTIKELTGGEEINARLNHANNTNTNLKLTFILECNEKPRLNESNEALSRRIIDIPFKSSFVDDQIYEKLTEEEKQYTFKTNSYYKTKEFKEKYKTAFFLILIDYHKKYLLNNKKLILPDEVIKRNNDYLMNSDDFYNWIDSQYYKNENTKKTKIKLKDIYNLYKLTDYYINLDKCKKRECSYKNFIKKMQTNIFLKRDIKQEHETYYLINYAKKIDDDEEEEEDKTPLDL